MTRGWFAGWSVFVVVCWVVLALLTDEGGNFTASSSYAPRLTFGETLLILFIPAAIVWSLGLLVLFIVGRLRGGRSSSGTGTTTGLR